MSNNKEIKEKIIEILSNSACCRSFEREADQILVLLDSRTPEERTNEPKGITTTSQEDWEKEIWAWITKEMPYKHSDRFAPLFRIVRQLLALLAQQKEELLKKLPKKKEVPIKNNMILELKNLGFNQALAEIKKLIEEI